MIERLGAIVGPQGLISDPAEMAPYLTDWRGRKTGRARCVVCPATTGEVAAVMKLMAEADEPVFAQGGNTGLCFAAVPEGGSDDRPGIVLSLRRLNRIRQLDLASDIVTVDAGVVLADLHEAAREAGREFPLTLGSEGSAQIGGLISTNAGGTAVLRYGPMRDLVAGLEVVLPDGRVLSDLDALRKDNTGYQLRHLFIGAEGTLGIITGAALRLHPRMPNGAHAWIAVDHPAAAVSMLEIFRAVAGQYIEAFELLSGSQIVLVQRHIPDSHIPFDPLPAWNLMVELSAPDFSTDLDAMMEKALATGLERQLVRDAVVARSGQQAERIWHVRHSVSEANKREGIGVVHDICVRTSNVADFIAAADACAAARFPEATTQVVCHLGDGNVHYILMFPHAFWQRLADPDAFALEVERDIHDVARRFGGTFSAEHGVGRKLVSEMERLIDPVRLEMMRRIKQVFDPHNRMNPGVLFVP